MSDRQWSGYIRRSTSEQSDEHQQSDIADWLDSRGICISNVDLFIEQGSGASDDREKFTELVDKIEDGTYTDVVIWEVSRVARKGAIAQEFFDACEDNGITIHVTNGSVREIRPDGTSRLIADIIASVAAEERRTLIRRTASGVRKARESGKWIGQPPTGFTADGGFLNLILDPDYEEGETGFFDVVEALKCVEDGGSYRRTAEKTPNVTRQTISNIFSDPERRRWYLERESDDVRVNAALSDLQDIE